MADTVEILEIHVRSKCDCKNGIRSDPTGLWREFNAWDVAAAIHGGRSDAECIAWWEERGYRWFSEAWPANLPGDEVPCNACKGTGYVERWVSAKLLLGHEAGIDDGLNQVLAALARKGGSHV